VITLVDSKWLLWW